MRNAGRHRDPARERLEELIRECDVNYKTVSLAIGRNVTYIQQFLKRNTPVRLAERDRQALAEYFRVAESEFRPQHSQRARSIRNSPASRESESGGANFLPYIEAIQELDTRAGPGRVNLEEVEPGAYWYFPPSWVATELRARTEELRIITIDGDSMVSDPPTRSDLGPGDKVVVNTSDTIPTPPGIFIIDDGLGFLAQRVMHIANSDPITVRIMPNNPKYPTYERTLEEARIWGRVIGRWQRF